MAKRKKMGRPKIKVDWKVFETACKLCATKEDIIQILGVEDMTLTRRIREKYDDTFEGVKEKLGGITKLSLRRNQLALSKTNSSMGIWLGKQLLNQKDQVEQKIDHSFSRPIISFGDGDEDEDEGDND